MLKAIEDEDVREKVSISDAVKIMEKVFRQKSEGLLISPPRFHVDTNDGKIVFTAGGSNEDHVAGFRVYTTFGKDDQFVAVYDSLSGTLKGIIHGSYTGILRTGAIGALSVKFMSRRNSENLGIIGSGKQAFIQAIGALSVRNFKRIAVYSPNRKHLGEFTEKLRKSTPVEVQMEISAENVARNSDVLVTATTSSVPVVKAEWIRPGTHVVSVGRKSVDEHELDPEIGNMASVVATDSLDQLLSYPRPHFMSNSGKTGRINEFSDIIAGKETGRSDEKQITLFLSVGLSGTEAILGNYIIDRVA